LLLLSRRLPMLIRRGGMVLFIALGLASPMLINQLLYGNIDRDRVYSYLTNQRLMSSDGAQVVEFVEDYPPKSYYTLQFIDYRRQRQARQQVTVPYLLLGLDGPDSVLLAGQGRREARMTVMRWCLADNRMEPLFSFRIRRGALLAGMQEPYLHRVSLHPGGRYAALQLPSLLGENAADLWLLDLRQKEARLTAVMRFGGSLSWTDDRLIVSADWQPPLQIDIITGKASPFPIILQEVRP